jgi:hypothetical protein
VSEQGRPIGGLAGFDAVFHFIFDAAAGRILAFDVAEQA